VLGLFVLGTGAGIFLPLDAAALLAGTAVCLGAAFWKRGALAGLWWLWGGVALLAWAHATMQVHPPSPRSLGAQMEREREQLTLRGRIIDDPVQEASGGWRLTLTLEEVNRLGDFQPATGKVDVWWRPDGATATTPAYGDRWECSGVVQRRAPQDRVWAFLPPYRMRVQGGAAQQLETGAGHWLKQLSFRGRRAAADRLAQGLSDYPDTVGILHALLLGYRHQLPEASEQLFAWTGTLHIFAISGLHVGIMAGLLLVVVRACGVSKRYWIWWVGPLLILYTIATGMRPSALRACTMALTFTSAFLFDRKPDAPSAWALAALLILAAAPTQLTSPGFLFSFIIVAGLIRLYPLLAGPARTLWSPDAYQPVVPGRRTPRLRRAGLALTALMATSLAAWLSSVPLTAHYFNLFSPIALIGNLFVIPAAFLIVLTGLLSLLTGMVTTVGAEVFNHANRWFIDGLIVLIEKLADWPGSYRYVRSPGLYWMLIWYGFIFGGLVWHRRIWQRAGYGALVLLACIGAGLAWRTAPDRVHVLPLGEGHAVLVQSERRHVLYDTGTAYRAPALIRHLRQFGVNKLDTLILGHAAAAHAGGAVAVLEAMPVGEVWVTGFASRSPVYNQAVQLARAQDVPVRTVAAGQAGRWSATLAWEVLHPAAGTEWRRAADAAMALRISRGHHAVLLTGGGGQAVEDAILQASIDPGATVWVLGHGGVPGAAGSAWLAAVAPAAAVLDIGFYERYDLPDRGTIDRLQGFEPMQLWRTDETGRITVELMRNRWRLQAARPLADE
jgi:competence protein ComEC